MTEHTWPPMRVGGVTSKLHDPHVRRLAIVYVRQSHPHQVVEHVESTARHSAWVDRAVAWGGARERGVVIDEDQGHSGQSMVPRFGCQRVLAEVSWDHGGLMLGREMSRVARSNTDWHPWLERCALLRTVLAEADGLDDPPDDHARLRLGRRGMMSEAALSLLTSRMLEGMRHQAKGGELWNHPPMGDVRGPEGDDQGDPDAQAPRVMRRIWDVFAPQGRRHGWRRSLVTQEIRLPIRPHGGATRGPWDWRRPTRMTLHTVRHHPSDAGAYRWGYRQLDPRQQQPGRRRTGRTVKAPDVCAVLSNDRFPASISWERCDAIQPRFAHNRAIAEALGAPREGPSLWGGLWVCGRCGRRWIPADSGQANRRRYRGSRGVSDDGAPLCLSLSGAFLDCLVVEPMLHVLQPASWALSLAAEHARRTERAPLEAHGQQRLERRHDEAERAARQYAAVEPEHRLGARALERRWEEAWRQAPQVPEA